MQNKKMATAAAVAGMSERSGHNWRAGKLPSDGKKRARHWRTHPDPFEGIWEEEVVPLLQSDRDGVLQAPPSWSDSAARTRIGSRYRSCVPCNAGSMIGGCCMAPLGRSSSLRSIPRAGRHKWTLPTAGAWG